MPALDPRTAPSLRRGPSASIPRVRHLVPRAPGPYEVDHLIPLELGGDNTIANLWPESAEPTPGFHQKDKVENFLHRQVCSGTMGLMEAQRQVATDWIVVWRRIEGQATAKGVGEDDGDGD